MPSLHIAGALVGSVFLVGQAVRVHVKEGVLSAADDAPPNLRHLTAVELKMSSFRSTLSQVLGSDVEALSEFVGDKITLFSGELAKAAEVCDETSRAATKAKLLSAFASIKSRLVMVVSTAAHGIKGDAESNAASAFEKFIKLQEVLAEEASNFYEEHLKDTFVEIRESFQGIAASAGDGREAALPEGLVGNITRFSHKIAELNGKLELATLSEDTFSAAQTVVDDLTTSAGRLVADMSRRFSTLWEEVVAMNLAAVSSVLTYGSEALQGDCGRQIRVLGEKAFELLSAVFSKVVAAVNNGVHEIKESMVEIADDLAAASVELGEELKAHSAKLYSGEDVKQTLSSMGEEILQFKELVKAQLAQVEEVAQSKTVANFADKFKPLFAKFMPRGANNKLRNAQIKAASLRDTLGSQVEEITSLVNNFKPLFAKFMPRGANNKLRNAQIKAASLRDTLGSQVEDINSLVTDDETTKISIEGNEK